MGFEIQNNILKKYIAEDNETDIIIPYGITEIGRFCFQDGFKITSIVIPDTVRKIDRFAFEYCKKLVNIKIPLSVVIIENYAFSYCELLEYIYIPESVKYIGDNIFNGCKNLQKIDISEKNPNYIIIDNVLFSRNMSNLLSYTISKTDKYYSVPEKVIRIGSSAFAGSNPERIDFPESLNTIEHLAFSGCENLENIKLSGNIVSLNSMTFLNCKNLKSIDIPLSVRNIRNYCFDNCTSLDTIKMPFDTELDENAFLHCSSIRNLILFDKKFSFSLHTEKNIRYSDMKKLLAFFESDLSEENFSLIKRSDCKIPVALFMLRNFENDFFCKYIQKNIRKAVKILTDENNSDTLKKVLFFRLINRKYIDEMIRYAEDTGRINIKNLLEIYKIQNKL